MKQIIDKYRLINEMLDDASDVDDITKAELRKCLAIHINGEILLEFDRYVRQLKPITADMIAFFYLHIQMSGAANEALSRGFTDSHPKLKRVLFDDTADGKGSPRLSRFAGAHSLSLTKLLNDFTPELLRDYMLVLKEVLPLVEEAIVSCVPSLRDALHSKIVINFVSMPSVDSSSPQVKANTEHGKASWLLESLKAIDVTATILSAEREDEFCSSHTAQALAILSRQIVANNMFLLYGKDPAFAELRQFRNCSAHAYVMWEVQNNPLKLRSNCIRLVLEKRDALLTQLRATSPSAFENYTQPPVVEIHVRDESSSSQPSKNQAEVKKKKKPAESKEQPAPKVDDSEFLAKRVEQGKMLKYFILTICQPIEWGPKKILLKDPIAKLGYITWSLEGLHEQLPDLHIHDINEPLTATAKGKGKIISNGLMECYFEVSISPEVPSSPFIREVNKKIYPRGLQKVDLYVVSEIFTLFSQKVDLLKDEENLALFINTLQKAFKYGASPNVTIQTSLGLRDVLSFAISHNFPKEVIIFLLENGAHINQVVANQIYTSPLNFAVRSRPDIVPVLLEAGANPLRIFYNIETAPMCKNTLWFDLIGSMESPINLRMASLRILFPYVYQKYGADALLANMRTPAWHYTHGRKIRERPISDIYKVALTLPTAEENDRLAPSKRNANTREDLMPALLLYQKVETVLTNPKFNFYKLILNDEIGIMVQAIDRLVLPEQILEAMGMTGDTTETHNGKKFTAVEFALELKLASLFIYLNRVRAYCYQMVCTAAIFNTPKYVTPMPAIIADYAMDNPRYSVPGTIYLDSHGQEQSLASRCL